MLEHCGLFGDLARRLRLDPVAQPRRGQEAAAEALKLTAQDLAGLGVIDEIVPEPLGGAHRGKADAINALGDALERALGSLTGGNVRDYRADRRSKFLSMGRKGLA